MKKINFNDYPIQNICVTYHNDSIKLDILIEQGMKDSMALFEEISDYFTKEGNYISIEIKPTINWKDFANTFPGFYINKYPGMKNQMTFEDQLTMKKKWREIGNYILATFTIRDIKIRNKRRVKKFIELCKQANCNYREDYEMLGIELAVLVFLIVNPRRSYWKDQDCIHFDARNEKGVRLANKYTSYKRKDGLCLMTHDSIRKFRPYAQKYYYIMKELVNNQPKEANKK